MMYVALSYDHRIIEGQHAVLCLVRVKELMEDPGVDAWWTGSPRCLHNITDSHSTTFPGRRHYRRRPRRIRRRPSGRTARPLDRVRYEMDKTLGGTCVNVGCIPSKALLTSTEHLEFTQGSTRAGTRHHAPARSGSTSRKDAQAQRLMSSVRTPSAGSSSSSCKNKITWAKGKGTLKAGNVVEVEPSRSSSPRAPEPAPSRVSPAYQGKATSSSPPAPCRSSFPVPASFDEERILSNTGALAIPQVPEASHRHRWRRHRPRARLRLAPHGRARDDRRARAHYPPWHGR